MTRLLMTILLVSAMAAHAKVYFRSHFERGISATAKEVLPGARTISLLPGESLNEWPAEGGIGIIEFNHPRPVIPSATQKDRGRF